MLGSLLELRDGDTRFRAYRSRPSAAGGPGVVVLHEGFGLDDCTRDQVDRLARAGFVALAPALADGEATRSPAEADRRAQDLRESLPVSRVEAAIAALRADVACTGSQVGVVGTGVGGELGVRLANANPRIAAAVDIGGIPTVPPFVSNGAAARFLLVLGADDPKAGEGTIDFWIEALRVLGPVVAVRRQPGAGADFASEARVDRFDAVAAMETWDAAVSFLRATL